MAATRFVMAASLAAAVCLAGPAGAPAKGGSGGGTPAPTPTPSGAVTVAAVSVSPLKVAYNSTATGTVRLNRTPAGPVTVSLSNDSNNSPVLAITPASVTITPPASSATFPVRGGSGLDGRTFSVSVNAFTPTSGASAQFYLVPFANTDLIQIPLAEISPSGDIKVQAQSDTPSAVLTASFNGTAIPLRSNGGGSWEGTAKVPVSGGDVEVRSNLGGCSARSPFKAGAWHFC
jgi:hypothetical protein